jgi:uncharacterized protein (TIGR03435 family)
MPTPFEAKPDIPPSYEVHISRSSKNGTESSAGPDYFVQRGFDLKALIAKVYEKDPSRVVLPGSLDDEQTYDVKVVLPRATDQEEIYRLVQQRLENYFGMSITNEYRPMDVYVMTAFDGNTPAAKTGDEAFGGGFISWSSEWTEIGRHDSTPPTIEMLRKMASDQKASKAAISDLSASNITMNDFRLALEQELKRPIIDETNLKGVYDIAVHGKPRSTDDFLQLLRDQTGIVLTPARRNVEMLVVKRQP